MAFDVVQDGPVALAPENHKQHSCLPSQVVGDETDDQPAGSEHPRDDLNQSREHECSTIRKSRAAWFLYAGFSHSNHVFVPLHSLQ